MTLPDAIVTLGVGVLGAGSALLATRLAAGGQVAHWRRDQLVRFSADLVAAANAVRFDAGEARQAYLEESVEVPWPSAKLEALAHAVACVLLIESELGPAANELQGSSIVLVGHRFSDEQEYAAAFSAYQAAAAGFLAAATKRIA